MEPITSFRGQALDDLRQVVRQVLNEPRNKPRRHPGGPAVQGVPNFWALTPSGGIPEIDGVTLGSADCDIYYEEEQANGDIDLVAWTLPDTSQKSETVYNASATAVSGDIYTPVWPTTEGRWMAQADSGSGGVIWETFTSTSHSTTTTTTVRLPVGNDVTSNSPSAWTADESDDDLTCNDAGYWSVMCKCTVGVTTVSSATYTKIRLSIFGLDVNDASFLLITEHQPVNWAEGTLVAFGVDQFAANDQLYAEVDVNDSDGSPTITIQKSRWVLTKVG